MIYFDLLNDPSDRVTSNALRSTWAPPLNSEISRLADGCGEANPIIKFIHFDSNYYLLSFTLVADIIDHGMVISDQEPMTSKAVTSPTLLLPSATFDQLGLVKAPLLLGHPQEADRGSQTAKSSKYSELQKHPGYDSKLKPQTEDFP